MLNLEMRQVSFAYFDSIILHNLNLSIKAGEMVGLLGPNGSGKTTLIKLASGILKPNQGEIRLNDSSLNQLRRKTVARNLAVVPQQFTVPFAFTVNEVVMLGRTPFFKTFSVESRKDIEAVITALDIIGINELRKRRFDELSGGERQKVILAMALAQQPKLLLLDEPTIHLDISHQIEVLELVKRLNTEQKITVIAAIHDLNLATLYFNRLILLKKGRVFADGSPTEVITEDIVKEVFAAPVKIEPHVMTGTPHVIITPKKNIPKVDN